MNLASGETEMDPLELNEKALLVRNLSSLRRHLQMTDDQLVDKLTIHFQNRKTSRGGDIQKVIYPLDSDKNDAIVIFEDAKDRKSAFQHEHVFLNQHPLTVKSLPPIFTSVDAKIDPLYFNIVRFDVDGKFSQRTVRTSGITVDKTCGKIMCSHASQLERIASDVSRLLMRYGDVVPNKKSALLHDREFEAAGASNFDLMSANQQEKGFEDFEGQMRDRKGVSEEDIRRAGRAPCLKQSDGPEDFLNCQLTTTDDERDRSEINQSMSVSQGNEAFENTHNDDSVERFKGSTDSPVVLDKYTYAYVKRFKDADLQKILKGYKVQMKVVPDETGDNLEGFIFPSSQETSAKNVVKAKDKFILFYQNVHFDIARKQIDCSSVVNTHDVEYATKVTLDHFKADTLITKVDGSPHLRLILRPGDVEEVARQFRKIAGIKLGKTLRTTGAGNQGVQTASADLDTTKSSEFGKDRSKVESRSTDPLVARTSSHDSQLLVQPLHQDTDFVTNEGINIRICMGDITKQSAQAVVIPSDARLEKAGTGVANAVWSAAGPQMKGYCSQIMKNRHGKLMQTSECIVTPGFKLNYSSIIHTVGPTFHRLQKFICELYSTFLNCLHTAEANKMQSVALPLIGSGFIGAPKNVCADALVQALLEFSRASTVKPNSVRKVLLVNIDKDSNEAIEECLKTALRPPSHASYQAMDTSTGGTVGSSFPQSTSVDTGKWGLPVRLPPTASGYPHNTTQHNTSAGQVKKEHQESTDGTVSSESYGNGQGLRDANAADKSTRDAVPQVELETKKSSSADKTNECPICFEDFTDVVALPKCKHKFCKKCIDRALEDTYKCPVCQTVCGEPRGNQPDGKMTETTSTYEHLPGYPGDGLITIHYDIPGGRQTANHPNPGRYFGGVSRFAYLPNNQEGREVLRLLRKAFEARLVFTVGTSITSGQGDTVTWNDIHHKTNRTGGTQNYGYPDPDYLKRVKEDLAAKGIV